MDKRKMSQSGATTAAGRMAYEGKVGVEAVVRSGGKNPQLKGVVHEILYRDSITMAPDNLIHGTKGALSKSATAIRDDVLTMQGGKVIGRAQLKDTVSSINKTVKQASSGKYAGTNLMGTKETAAAYNSCVDKLVAAGKQAPQKMTSTGISSSDTARIASQTIGGSVKAASVARTAMTSGGAGAMISGGIEAAVSGYKLLNGEIDGAEFVGNVARETVGGGISAAAGSAAATVAATGAATVLAATSAPLWVPAAVGVGAAVAIGSCVKSLWDSLWF